MKPTGHRPHCDSRHRDVRFGRWRAVVAAPAMLGSLLLVTLVSVTLRTEGIEDRLHRAGVPGHPPSATPRSGPPRRPVRR